MSLPPQAYGSVRPTYGSVRPTYGSVRPTYGASTYGRATVGPSRVVRRSVVPTYGVRGPTFIPRPPTAGGVGAGLGRGSSAGSLAGLIGGLAVPLLCLGCLATMGLLGLFATMIGAAVYMNRLQQLIRKLANAGTTLEINYVVLLCALLCSIYVLTKHRRVSAIRS